MRLLVTGAAGQLGRAVVPALLADPRVTELVAVDPAASPFADDPRLRWLRRDLVTTGAEELLDGVDVAIHLAFRVARRPGEDPAALNLHAGGRFLRAAAMRARTLLFASSVVAYGYADRPQPPLDEQTPPAPDRGFYYAAHKIALERLLAELAGSAPARIVIARPCVVGGPSMPPTRAANFRGTRLVLPRSPWPRRFQLVHEADLASAFLALLDAPGGAYNVAPDDWLPAEEVAALLHVPIARPPRWLAAAACELAWRLGRGEISGDWVRTLAWPVPLLANARLRGLGWTPRFTTAETILAIAGRPPGTPRALSTD